MNPERHVYMDKWAKKAHLFLVGKKIAQVRYLYSGELQEMGWNEGSLVIIFDDGSYIFASQDDEGNGPGALFTSDKKLPIIPVV